MNRLAGIYSTRSNHISVVEVRKSFVSLADCFTKGCSAKYNTNALLKAVMLLTNEDIPKNQNTENQCKYIC